jgi:zinc transporter ZupT
MPGVFQELGARAGLWLLGGFFIQLLLEVLSQGVEHGHIHAHERAGLGFAVQIMVGLCLHAYLEGAPLSGYHDFYAQHHAEEARVNHLLFGIILHKAPAAFALVALLLRSGFRYQITAICLLVFASMSPLGALTGEQLHLSPAMLNSLIALVIGSFLHIATTILFEAENQRTHQISWWKLLVIGAGILLAVSTL